MTRVEALGAVLSIWGALGMYIAGKGQWKGWAMGLAAQPIWLAFAFAVDSWPLAFSPLLYGTVYARNLWRWKTGKLKPKGRPLIAAKIVNHHLQPDMNRRDRRAAARAAARKAGARDLSKLDRLDGLDTRRP